MSESSSFLVLSVSVVGILFISILLLAYYLFLACSCRRQRSATSTDQQIRPRRGLEEAAIRRIPTLRYQHKQHQQHCAVCLADFREGERLRRLPPCLHSFHIDCIDAWLAAALTCPLCRAHVAIATHSSSSPAAAARTSCTTSSSTRQPDADEPLLSVSSVHQPQPMRRRSLSLDSCADKNLYLALRTIVLPPQQLCSALLQDPQGSAAVSGKRLRRSFFSFSHGRSSQTLILPISTQM